MPRYLPGKLLHQLLALLSIAVAAAPNATAQSRNPAPRSIDFAVGYTAIHANAPPGGCNCFFMQGARADVNVHLHEWLSGVAEVGGAHASKINTGGDDVSMITYLFGPRATLHARGRFSPFGQVLLGAAHGFNGYFPTKTSSSTSANSFALSTGGGLDFAATPHFAVRVIQADYLYTGLPNAQGDRQNSFRVGAGIVFHWR